jgi:UDP-N-acetylglucosamine 2-epimerase (non-hydrolysing)
MGTRPEAIKLAPIVVAARASERLQPLLLSTGQHREVQDKVLSLFGLRPDLRADVMRPEQTLAKLSAGCLTAFDMLLRDARPDVVVVQGDTTSATMGALAAFYDNIPVWHVEAGLRTSTPRFPFPEEMNRRLITKLASFHLAPTEAARENLLLEHVAPSAVAVTGNTGIDALLRASELALPIEDPALREAVEAGEPLLLVTLHRRENWGPGARSVARAVRRLAEEFRELRVVYAAHPNPVVRQQVEEELAGHPRVLVADPVGYGDFVRVLARATVIVTDSGGIQEEAPSLRVPVLVARTETERTEALEAGLTKLVGADEEAIVAETSLLLADAAARAAMCAADNPYGDGRAAERIVELLEQHADELLAARAQPTEGDPSTFEAAELPALHV